MRYLHTYSFDLERFRLPETGVNMGGHGNQGFATYKLVAEQHSYHTLRQKQRVHRDVYA